MDFLKPSEIVEKFKEQQKKLEIVDQELTSQKKNLSLIWALIAAILIAFFITFILLGIDAWRFHGQKKCGCAR